MTFLRVIVAKPCKRVWRLTCGTGEATATVPAVTQPIHANFHVPADARRCHPPSHSHAFVATLVYTVNLAIILNCDRSIGFKCFLKYPTATLKDAQYAQVTPPPHHGKAALCPITRTMTGEPCFDFQKFKFIYEPPRDDLYGAPKFQRVLSRSCTEANADARFEAQPL